MDMVVRWPEGGVVTLDWVMGLGNVLDYASRNLQPSQLPDVIPVSVADSLILAASKVCILACWVGWGRGGGFF
jgi:serine/threonine-protein phosphatase 5